MSYKSILHKMGNVTNTLYYKWSMLKVLVTQSRPTLCDPVAHSLPGSSVYGIRQGRMLGWVAISSRGSPYPEIGPGSLVSPVLAGGLFSTASDVANSFMLFD